MSNTRKGKVSIRVRYNECDPTGFAYNANFFTWINLATSDYFREVGVDLRELAYSSQTFMAVHLSCDFKRPVSFEDVIEVRHHLENLGESSLSLRFEIFKGEELMAAGKSIQVFMDTSKKVKIAIPENLRRQLQ